MVTQQLTPSETEVSGPARQLEGRVQVRRARTRQRLLEVTEELVRARGVEAVTVDDIADAADISRRSFYHHFESKHDLIVPMARAHTLSLNCRIDRLVEDVQDPAETASIALRHTLRGIVGDPLSCWFILHSGLPHDRLREGIGESAARDLDRGVRTGRFVLSNRNVLEHLCGGAVLGVLSARIGGALVDDDLDDAVEHVLRILGLKPDEAHEIAHRPLPELPGELGDVADAGRRKRRPAAARK